MGSLGELDAPLPAEGPGAENRRSNAGQQARACACTRAHFTVAPEPPHPNGRLPARGASGRHPRQHIAHCCCRPPAPHGTDAALVELKWRRRLGWSFKPADVGRLCPSSTAPKCVGDSRQGREAGQARSPHQRCARRRNQFSAYDTEDHERAGSGANVRHGDRRSRRISSGVGRHGQAMA